MQHTHRHVSALQRSGAGKWQEPPGVGIGQQVGQPDRVHRQRLQGRQQRGRQVALPRALRAAHQGARLHCMPHGGASTHPQAAAGRRPCKLVPSAMALRTASHVSLCHCSTDGRADIKSHFEWLEHAARAALP